MTRPLPSSELQLTRARVRAQISCPTCKAPPGQPCAAGDGLPRQLHRPDTSPNHRARIDAARALVRARRLERP